MIKNKTIIEIVICDTCRGSGSQFRSYYTCHHKGEVDYESWTCEECGGSGRLKQTSVISKEPYKPKA